MALVSLLLRCCSIEDRRLPLSLSLSRSSRVSSSTPVVRRNVCACSRDCSCLPAAAAVLPLPSRSYPLTRRTRASDCQRRCRPDIIFDSSLTLALLVLKEREKSSNTHTRQDPSPTLSPDDVADTPPRRCFPAATAAAAARKRGGRRGGGAPSDSPASAAEATGRGGLVKPGVKEEAERKKEEARGEGERGRQGISHENRVI